MLPFTFSSSIWYPMTSNKLPDSKHMCDFILLTQQNVWRLNFRATQKPSRADMKLDLIRKQICNLTTSVIPSSIILFLSPHRWEHIFLLYPIILFLHSKNPIRIRNPKVSGCSCSSHFTMNWLMEDNYVEHVRFSFFAAPKWMPIIDVTWNGST